MCEKKTDGPRCATHTRPAYQAALATLADGRATPAALAAVLSAATAYASTPSGQADVTAAASAHSGLIAALLTDAAGKGRAALATRQAARLETAALTASPTPPAGTRPTPASMPASRPAARTRPSVGQTPGGWTISAHLLAQAASKGIPAAALIAAIDTPATVYPSRRYPDQDKHIRDGICVAVNPATRTAITCFVDRVETDLRADQTDADAAGWNSRRQARQPR
jgi:hypothetical protein